MDTDILKKRISFAGKLTKFFYNYFNSKLDLKKLQETYKADKGRITRLDLTDINVSIHFRLKNGKFEILKNVNKPDNIILAPSDMYFSLFEKEHDAIIQEMMTRWRFGEISFFGETAMADFKLFIKAIKDLKDSLPKIKQEAVLQSA
ncbi:MAG: hypothetical protein Q8J68_07890 [Methanolobus sp.]|uniref:SCP2 sterol-binding domain-containing protein n=1 Tax=Methanolobus sp. TaxID=1874737 RepID=UPI00273134DF|nr:hypothetical protein [Methanolobus sp.]MDP2217189.1 hypothetical protein [Methanolobus sp.]